MGLLWYHIKRQMSIFFMEIYTNFSTPIWACFLFAVSCVAGWRSVGRDDPIPPEVRGETEGRAKASLFKGGTAERRDGEVRVEGFACSIVGARKI